MALPESGHVRRSATGRLQVARTLEQILLCEELPHDEN